MSESNITLESVVDLQRQYRFQFEPAQNSYVLLYPEGLVKLEGGAGEIMKRVDGKLSVEGIVQALQQSFPGVELRHGAIEQFSGNAAFLQLGANRQRAEKADAAPAGRKVRTDQLAVEARAETRDMRRAVAAADIIAVVPERRQVGDAEISGERLAQDQRGVIQIVLIKSADNGAARD